LSSTGRVPARVQICTPRLLIWVFLHGLEAVTLE
jgi:hypothetical protein